MDMRRRTLIAAIAVAAGAPGALAQPTNEPQLPPALEVLRTLPLTRTDGAALQLGDVLAPRRAAVISFWATWCAPCFAEARHLAETRRRVPQDRLDIIGINVDRRRDEALIAQFLERTGANYTQVRGELSTYQAFGGGGEIALPRLFVFNAEGQPQAAFGRYTQFVTIRQIDRAIARVIAG